MSEINSIANGTYTIGQTSATNFVAGPGIRIDEPSAGTVRIGNDETVLWSGNTGSNSHTTAFTLSESFSAFNKIRFEGVQFGASTPTYEISTPYNPNSVGVCFQYYTFENDNNPYQIRCASYSATDGLNFTLFKEKFLYWSNTGLTANGGNTTQGPNIQRIVGINRISGSNA